MRRPLYPIIRAYHDDQYADLVYHEVKLYDEAHVDDGKITHEYAAIKGGLSWPTNESPGYYIIMGQRWDGRFRRADGVRKRHDLMLMAEYQHDHVKEGHGFKRFMDQLTDDSVLYGCDTFYTSLSNERELEYQEMFRDYLSENKALPKGQYINVLQAPFADPDNFILGLQLITDMAEAGRIDGPEDSVVNQQIGMVGDNLPFMEKPHVTLFAINAMRYVIGAFYKIDFTPTQFEETGKKHWLEM